ncbi:DUF1588 domain-containing protein [Tuwongella immobilis]|uniref:Cytochrome c domain-containing protein n=1 Tax=Tuwongella immobilis TaxID=692036 RepID=A0A6C2YLN7_9BACT|nr:DUF1588 domain-containing protein [Tuwongella immobilis]VIP02231.1 Uncharacterized protein OS=Pirellula staleyi (strain ATCC 27377 / DSM 6068 / ICPB 4128) GN=Psta_0306 PE=4 SV=1: PSD4: PSCyt3 [Tuwongella immobilis]VTS00780.1 Uncharacterized protein OS=Pirellula staleyi (strain ATCC 27377 / DSM 6068 / ICPB 4128) GN=Psta_0306 PE=4 SV=1: PSD4: PSCyt3 [Tuwongella immobilis]
MTARHSVGMRWSGHGRWSAILAILVIVSPAGIAADAPSPTNSRKQFTTTIRPFLEQYCIRCHSEEDAANDIRLDILTDQPRSHTDLWLSIVEQLRDRRMPPAKSPQPTAQDSQTVIAWALAGLGPHGARLPNHGNRVPHELLFGPTSAAESTLAPTMPRVWRLSPDAYLGWARDVYRGRLMGLVQPFTLTPDRGIRDYAGLYSIDEPTAEILLRNAQMIVAAQTASELRNGKLSGKNDSVREFLPLLDSEIRPTTSQLQAAIEMQYRLAIGRLPTDAERQRLIAFYERCRERSDGPSAGRTMLQAILLKTDAMYRQELSRARASQSEAAPLAQEELVRALSLALGDRRDAGLMTAASKGQLQTREQIAEQLRRMLTDPKADRSRVLRFFREYFEYHHAADVFKDRPMDKIKHLPDILIRDTDRLVLHILQEDRDVFRQLLTTTQTFANTNTKQNKQTRKDELVPADVLPPPPPPSKKRPPEWVGTVEAVYGFREWPKQQPIDVPEQQRLGILMQPSWLVAWSTNFDNDPVRRGRWIRERLLGGTVPDLPIGVQAQVPDDPHRTYRDRLTVTRDARCWKCHQRMDELGLPFEQFDHYGRYRTAELVLDEAATAANRDPKGKPLGPVFRPAKLVTTGIIAESGDSQLDGPIESPHALVRKLANSTRARQVFIRHVFRYFMGRNETLADARTLQSADRAYVQSGGSMNELLIALLTSDSFLLRSSETVARGETK